MTNSTDISYSYRNEHLFFTSVFFSSLGTLLFQFCFAVFAISKGWSIAHVGIAIGLSRLIQIVSMSIFGDVGDKKNPKIILIYTELIGAILNGFIAFSWKYDTTIAQLAIVLTMIIRSSVISLQIPLRAKISKLLSNDIKSENRRLAVTLNIATQGTVLIAAILSILFFRYSNFYWVLLFDTFSFIFGGFVIWKLQLPKSTNNTQPSVVISFLEKFEFYYSVSPKLFWMDVMSSIPVCGTQALFIRLAFKNADTFGVLWMLYGVAAIITAPIVSINIHLWRKPICWILLGLSFVILGSVTEHNYSQVVMCGFVYVLYWILVHSLDAEYQAETEIKYFAAVTSARNIMAIAIISLGEIIVSVGSSRWTVSLESTLRGLFSISIGLVIYIKYRTRSVKFNLVSNK